MHLRTVIRVTLGMMIAALAHTAVAGETVDKTVEERCAKAEEAADLKDCLKSYRSHLQKVEGDYEQYIDLVNACLEMKTAREVRFCVAGGARPPTASTPSAPPPPAPSAAAERPPTSEPPKPIKPEWTLREEASRMDGSPSVFLHLLADEPVATRYGTLTRPSLHLRCHERTTTLYVAGKWYLGSQPVQVMIRFDQDKPIQQSWQVSSDNEAAGLWAGSVSIPFVKAMLTKETMLLRLAPYNDSAREMAFTIAGLSKVIEPLRKACGW